MKSKNGRLTAIAILTILIVVYNVVLFMIAGFSDHTAVFWLSWFFVMMGFGSMFVVAKFLGEEGLRMRDWIFGFPMLMHTGIYVAAEALLSIIFMLLELEIDWKWAFIPQFLLFAVYLVMVIGCFFALRTIREVKTHVKDKTTFIRMLRVDAEMLVSKCDDPELKALCQKLAEDIRFSDPMSNEALFELEKEIALAVSSCNDALAIYNLAAAKTYCNKASELLLERNRKCKVLK